MLTALKKSVEIGHDCKYVVHHPHEKHVGFTAFCLIVLFFWLYLYCSFCLCLCLMNKKTKLFQK